MHPESSMFCRFYTTFQFTQNILFLELIYEGVCRLERCQLSTSRRSRIWRWLMWHWSVGERMSIRSTQVNEPCQNLVRAGITWNIFGENLTFVNILSSFILFLAFNISNNPPVFRCSCLCKISLTRVLHGHMLWKSASHGLRKILCIILGSFVQRYPDLYNVILCIILVLIQTQSILSEKCNVSLPTVHCSVSLYHWSAILK